MAAAQILIALFFSISVFILLQKALKDKRPDLIFWAGFIILFDLGLTIMTVALYSGWQQQYGEYLGSKAQQSGGTFPGHWIQGYPVSRVAQGAIQALTTFVENLIQFCLSYSLAKGLARSQSTPQNTL